MHADSISFGRLMRIPHASARRAASVCLVLLALASHGGAVAQEAADQVLQDDATDAAPAAEDSLLPANDTWLGDFDGMRERRRIRMLVPFSKTFFFVDRGGQHFGMTYEIGKAFEDWLNKKYKTKALRIDVVFLPVARDRLLGA